MTEYTRDAMDNFINQETRKTALKFIQNVVPATPVDKGQARANWQVSISTPKTTILKATDKSGSATITQAFGVIQGARDVDYPVIWAVNLMPYIGVLNEGSSAQAPAKFVETALKRAQNAT